MDNSKNESVVDDRIEEKEPRKYNIIIYNDDYTPFNFVLLILTRIFNKTEEQANIIASEAHKNEKAVIGTYTAEIAEIKMGLANANARRQGFPLKCEAHEA